MDAAYIAAFVIVEAFKNNDFSTKQMEKYAKCCKTKWSSDFYWSTIILHLTKDHPRLIDAAATVIQRKGPQAILLWAMIISGVKPKLEFLLWFIRPDVFALTLYYVFKYWMHARLK
eukprot:TRINITY_DN8284_c0_g1_i1.p1 TRINITY_DN8284_c0_g1~~TRINITY_DN8284_c0_g1_i1.p1  ORF type:complete len:116 (+),score=16.65 TRINITY_DN8284_c0_g1_i1:35-382(+)